MSNYHDDTIETAVASNSTWLGISASITEIVKASAIAIVFFGSLIVDQAQASDFEFGTRGTTVEETTQAADQFYLKNEAIELIEESFILKDLVFSHIEDIVFESSRFEDIDISKFSSSVYEHATAQDSDLSNRTAYQVVYDSVVLSDSAFAYASNDTIEQGIVTDSVFDQLSAHSIVVNSAQIEDYELSSYVSVQYVSEQAHASDSVYGVLQAFTLTQDTAYLEDEVLLNTLSAQAWVSHSKTWAMSRYAPFNFEGVAVINGKIHLYNDQGVYVMDGADESISATIEIGALDFGEQLTHPLSAYLEYQLSGQDKSLDIQVSTTQSGSLQQYKYLMLNEKADYLTNGRVLFGRGLRGRHFGFKININAQSAQINALSIEHTPTRRRI